MGNFGVIKVTTPCLHMIFFLQLSVNHKHRFSCKQAALSNTQFWPPYNNNVEIKVSWTLSQSAINSLLLKRICHMMVALHQMRPHCVGPNRCHVKNIMQQRMFMMVRKLKTVDFRFENINFTVPKQTEIVKSAKKSVYY